MSKSLLKVAVNFLFRKIEINYFYQKRIYFANLEEN